MIKIILVRILPVLLFMTLSVCTFAVWKGSEPDVVLERVPMVRPDLSQTVEEQADQIEPQLVELGGTPSKLDGSWPRFRGENFDGISRTSTDLLRDWPDNGPEVLWSIPVGEGYAGAAVRNGRVYLLDYDREKQADVLRCLSLDTGKDIWNYMYPVKVKRNHGMSRTVPAVNDKYVVTMGPKCQVLCADAKTGVPYWRMDLVDKYDTVVPPWYAGQCPLIEGDKVILAPAGTALMIAVDVQSGQILWETPNPNQWKMTHSSIVPMELDGQEMYAYCASGGVVGVSSEDGRILWETDQWKIRIANIPTPVVVPDGRLFLSGGYNAGAMMLQLKRQGDTIIPEPLYTLDPETFGSAQHTPIYYEGYIYGVRPDEQLCCLDLDGNVIWTSGSENTFGIGPYMIANGLIYVMDDHGVLSMAPATPDGFTLLDTADVLEGHDSWGPLAIASGRLLARDLTTMICLKAGEPQ